MDDLVEQMCDPMVEYVKGLRDDTGLWRVLFFGLRSMRKGRQIREKRVVTSLLILFRTKLH